MTGDSLRNLKEGHWYWISKAAFRSHAKTLGPSGVAVYNALAYFAHWKDQFCFPTQKTMAELLGVSQRTVMRKLQQLQQLGLVGIEKQRGKCVYYLLSTPEDMTQETPEGDKNDTGQVTGGNANYSDMKDIKNNKKRLADKSILNVKKLTSGEFKPETREELLALDLAEGLGDRQNLPVYLSYAHKHPESLLRQLLGEVLEMREENLKKGRAPYFHYLLKKRARETVQDIRP